MKNKLLFNTKIVLQPHSEGNQNTLKYELQKRSDLYLCLYNCQIIELEHPWSQHIDKELSVVKI